jgi:hypothetical protein
VHEDGATNSDVTGPRLNPRIVAGLVITAGAAVDFALMVVDCRKKDQSSGQHND